MESVHEGQHFSALVAQKDPTWYWAPVPCSVEGYLLEPGEVFRVPCQPLPRLGASHSCCCDAVKEKAAFQPHHSPGSSSLLSHAQQRGGNGARPSGCGHNLCWEDTLQCKLSGASQSSLRAVRELQRAQLKQEISQKRRANAVPTAEKRRYRAKNITDQSASLDFLSQIWRKYKLLTSQLLSISPPKSGGTNQAACNHKKGINDSQHGSDN